MPKTLTHTYFILDVYDELDKKSQQRLINHKEYLKTFAESTNILYLYNFNNCNNKKKVKNLIHNFHTKKTKEFFENLIKYIKSNKLEKNPEIIALLYGFISHYILDITLHPYIYYKSGILDKKKKNTYKYNGMHEDIESYFDAYMIYTKEGIEPKKFKLHQFLYNINSLSPETISMLDWVFAETYNHPNIGRIYGKAIKRAKRITKKFMYDPLGFKKGVYKIIDKITSKSTKKLETLSYCIHHKKKQYYLNLDKNVWHHPVDQNETYNYSFIEMYRIAILKTLDIINKVNTILYNNKELTILDELFSDLSYETAKPCYERQKMIYFEF
ncbi:MAG: zinc dependent phospholipase C family protein [Bacilli bacterium]|nr:zinc dependent phospholipase C family protein [Bacilli bacterium]